MIYDAVLSLAVNRSPQSRGRAIQHAAILSHDVISSCASIGYYLRSIQRCIGRFPACFSMVDLLPYRFEPERREVDRSSSADEGDSTGTPSGDDGTEDEDRVGNTDWCSCGKCYSMPSAAECLLPRNGRTRLDAACMAGVCH